MTTFTPLRRSGFTFIDLIAVTILVPLLLCGGATCWGGGCRSRETANRVKCASNLRQIGQAILLYANDNKGAYPRTVFTSGETVTPVWGTGATALHPFQEGGPQPNDVTAALFLLLRTQDITSEVFTCPSSNTEKDIFGGDGNTALNRSNFTDVRKNLAYSYQNPYPNDGAIGRGFKLTTNITAAEFAVASDINPGTAGTNDNVLAVTTSSSAQQMKQANSNNHDEDGQNVLYADGHVEFQSNPFVGIDRENIFTARTSAKSDPKSELIVASPYDANDSILLPTDD